MVKESNPYQKSKKRTTILLVALAIVVLAILTLWGGASLHHNTTLSSKSDGLKAPADVQDHGATGIDKLNEESDNYIVLND